ncbi:MAG: potassium channel family protein [Myxococcales bacterium]|nr:potassium channel family protein [Myxococcales bacterium]
MPSFAQRIPTHAALLIVLLALVMISPLVSGVGAGFVLELMFDAVLLAGVYSVGPSHHRWPFLVLTVVTLGVRWGEQLSGGGLLDLSALGITVVWLGYAIWILVAHLFQQREVTVNMIFGAVVTYLLIAVAFALVFQILELQHQGSFSGVVVEAFETRKKLDQSLMYFSLVCLTTMGFGDIVPVSNLARPLAVLEGVFGQLYLAVMIARLVGLHIAHESRARE